MKFPCSKCGKCCANIGKSILYAKLLVENGDENPVVKEMADFPYKTDEFGACEKLVDNRCSVYTTRPDICNVHTIWSKHIRGRMTAHKFYELNKQACEKLNGL